MGEAHVVVFTTRVSAERVYRALRAGVHGFLLKQMAPLNLAHALRSLAAGQQVFAPEATMAMASAPPGEQSPGQDLSQREREVLALLARGFSNQAISVRLCLSRATVKFHCSNLFAKLGVVSRSQAVAAAYRRNLVPHLVADGDQRERAQDGEEPDRAVGQAYRQAQRRIQWSTGSSASSPRRAGRSCSGRSSTCAVSGPPTVMALIEGGRPQLAWRS